MADINYLKLAASIILCQMAGFIGSLFTISSVSTWYLTLEKPSFNPPSWLFGPVWISLYFIMGISFYLIWNDGVKSRSSKTALILFGIQLVLNSLWSIIFFGLKMPLFAFLEIILLLAAILLAIWHFNRISKTASYLLVPYFLWVSFAAILNFSIYWLNR
jgi:translocator protein